MPNPSSSNGQAVIEYELTVPNSRPIILKPGIVNHDHSSLTDTIYGLCAYSHRLRTTTTDFVDSQLKEAMASGTPRVRFRLGYGLPTSMFWLPWQEHIVTFFSAILESISNEAGHTIELQTQDLQFLMQRASRFQSRKGTISKIIEEIASAYDFGENVIEATTGEGLYIQSNLDDSEFVRKRMIRRARNDKGRGNYLFYFKDNALHFHSPDYQGEIHTVSYFQSNGAALTQIDHSQKLLDKGVAGTSVIAYDPYSGQTGVAVSEPEHALRLADSIYDYAKTDANFVIPYHQSANFAQEAEVIGQNTYEHTRASALSLTLEVDKTIQIRHGDFINLLVTPSDSKVSPWSGFYLVTEARHIVQKGAVRSVYVLARGEIRKSLVNLVSAATDTILVIEQDAPGQSLNVGELKSSQRTKGAGNAASDGRLFATVQSPN